MQMPLSALLPVAIHIDVLQRDGEIERATPHVIEVTSLAFQNILLIILSDRSSHLVSKYASVISIFTIVVHNVHFSVDENDKYKGEYSQMLYENYSEEEQSHVELLKLGGQTVIEEVITRVEETEKEVIEEKNFREQTL
jgi:hypothetical protein